MTPAARAAACIEILDAIAAGTAVEPALLAWARGHRFAGSKDRAAIRDLVFSIERRRRSCAAMGGGSQGRALLRGYLAQEGQAEAEIFGQGPYAPAPLRPDEPALRAWEALSAAEQADLPDWIWAMLTADYPQHGGQIAAALRLRAPVWLRVNTGRTTRARAAAELEAAGHAPEASEACATALRVRARERQLAQHPLVAEGAVEFQDLGPQIALAALTVTPGMTALDYCAGGGGKALALAARGAQVTAHDAAPARMADLPRRAARAGAKIAVAPPRGTYDLVLCDVPCSGSGAWRRAVHGKWSLTPDALAQRVETQREILRAAADHVRPGGRLVYMTCALFAQENQDQARWFGQEFQAFDARMARQLTPLEGCDGFFFAEFERKAG